MVRQVILKIGTTGLDHRHHKIAEIAAVEIIDGKRGTSYHQYINPRQEFDAGATAVNKLKLADLQEAPVFEDIAENLVDFIGDAEIVLHRKSTKFELKFINQALLEAGYETLKPTSIISVNQLYRNKISKEHLSVGLEKISSALNIQFNSNKGTNAEYLCDRLCEAFLRLKDVEPSRRAGLRPRVHKDGHIQAASAISNTPFISEFFKECSKKRKLEEMEAKAQTNNASSSRSFN